MTDDVLIRAARKGDDHAFTEIVRRYESKVAATVIGMLGSGSEAEDTGQEVFIRFYRNLDYFKGESSLGTYLTRIAMNLSLNVLKQRKRRRLMFWDKPVEEIAQSSGNPSGEFSDDREIIEKMLQKLPPDFRSVIVLRLIEGYSTRETAEILKLPEGTVLSRLSRAQKKLKFLLSPYFGEEYGNKNSRPAASVI